MYIVTIGYDMQYLGLTPFSERGNGFVNGRQVDIAVMCISLPSVNACSTCLLYTSLGGDTTYIKQQTLEK